MCRKTSFEFSKLGCNCLVAEEDQENLKLGVGLLHVELKCLDLLLEISYKQYLTPRTWNVPEERKRNKHFIK